MATTLRHEACSNQLQSRMTQLRQHNYMSLMAVLEVYLRDSKVIRISKVTCPQYMEDKLSMLLLDIQGKHKKYPR